MPLPLISCPFCVPSVMMVLKPDVWTEGRNIFTVKCPVCGFTTFDWDVVGRIPAERRWNLIVKSIKKAKCGGCQEPMANAIRVYDSIHCAKCSTTTHLPEGFRWSEIVRQFSGR